MGGGVVSVVGIGSGVGVGRAVVSSVVVVSSLVVVATGIPSFEVNAWKEGFLERTKAYKRPPPTISAAKMLTIIAATGFSS